MFRRFVCLAILTASTLSATNWWYPYAEVRGRGGDYRTGGMVHGFMPIMQNEKAIAFAQGRAGRMRYETTAGLGGGIRHLIGSDSFVGVAGFCDWSRSSKNFNYISATASGELILGCGELRGNIYLPSRKTHVISQTVTDEMIIEGVQIIDRRITDQLVQQGYPGFDVEAGFNYEMGCSCRFRGYAAFYQYQRAGLPTISGPRLRLRYEADNLLVNGTRLLAEGIYQYDSIRGSQAEAMMGVRIPLGRPNCPCLPSALRRMNDLVERDLGLIFRQHDRQIVDDELIAQLFFFAEGTNGIGTQTDPTNVDVVEVKSTPGDILFALNDFGPIQLDLDQLVLKSAQQLYGFDDQMSVDITLPNGAILTVTDLTMAGRATLHQMNAAPVVTAADGTNIFGLEFLDGTIGLNIDSAEDVTADKLVITDSSVAGIKLSNTDNVSVTNTVIDVTAATGIDIFAASDSFFGDMNVTTTTGTVYRIDGLTGPVAIDNNTLTATTGTGLHITDGSLFGDVTITNSTLSHAGTSALIDGTVATLNLAGLTISNTNMMDKNGIRIQDTLGGTISFGTVDILMYDNSGQGAVSLTDNQAWISFNDLDIQGMDGTGFFAQNNQQITVSDGSIDVDGAIALFINNSPFDVTLSSVTSTLSPAQGIVIANSTGDLVVTGSTLIDQPNTHGVLVQLSTLDATFNDLTLIGDGIADGFGIYWLTSNNGSLTANGPTSISDFNQGILVELSEIDFTFADLDIDTVGQSGIILITNVTGTFDANDTTISNALAGLTVNNCPSPGVELTFGSFTADPVEDFGINWIASDGSLTVNGATSIGGLLNNSAGVSVINNSDADFNFNTVSIVGTAANNSDGLVMVNTSSTLTATDVTILDTEFGIRTDGTGLTEWMFDSLTLGTDTQRLEIAIQIEADTNITVIGDTDIWVEDRNVSWPTGIASYDGEFNGTFGDITMDLNDQGVATAFDINSNSGTTIIETKDVVLNNTVWGLFVRSPTTLKFDDLTIQPNCRYGIDWGLTGSSGSFTAADVIIKNPNELSGNGIQAGLQPAEFFCFDSLTIEDSVPTAIEFDDSEGTFTVKGLTKLDNPSGLGIHAFGSPNSVDIELGSLEIDYNVAGDHGVFLQNHTGDFTVSNGGHIIYNVAGNQSGILATDSSGNISITGPSVFEIDGAGQGAAAGPLGGVVVLDNAALPVLTSLVLDNMNIHDIGAGSGQRYGVKAEQVADLIQITNSSIAAIDGAANGTDSNGIDIDNRPQPDAGTLVLTITDNEISGATDFSTTQRGINFQMGDLGVNRNVVADIARNELHDLSKGIDFLITDSIGAFGPDAIVKIRENTIFNLGGAVDAGNNTAIEVSPAGFTQSIMCITDNIIDADLIGGNLGADYAIDINPGISAGLFHLAQITVEGNIINANSMSNFAQDGMRLEGPTVLVDGDFIVLIDNNTINGVTGHGVNILSRLNTITTVTLTNNTSNGDAVAESLDTSTLNVLFGDPSSPGSNGNDFATQYGLTQTGGTFNLGSTGVAANATDALTNLGNLTGGASPPTVNTAGVINLIDANTTNFPQPAPCP